MCCMEPRKQEGEPATMLPFSPSKRGNQSLNNSFLDTNNVSIFGDEMVDYGTDDEEIAQKFRNPWEKPLKMTKHGLVELFERLNAETPALGKWDCKINQDDIKVFVNVKGSEVTKEFPLAKAEMYFPSGTRISRIMRAIHNVNTRTLWDKDIDQAGLV
jgi:hypothetical protein